jgi:hypothetical protein
MRAMLQQERISDGKQAGLPRGTALAHCLKGSDLRSRLSLYPGASGTQVPDLTYPTCTGRGGPRDFA